MSADNVIRPTCFPYLTISAKQAFSFLMNRFLSIILMISFPLAAWSPLIPELNGRAGWSVSHAGGHQPDIVPVPAAPGQQHRVHRQAVNARLMRLLLPEHRLQDSVAELEPRQPKLFCEVGAVISFFFCNGNQCCGAVSFWPGSGSSLSRWRLRLKLQPCCPPFVAEKSF